MGTKRIQGITIELAGDTSGLQESLKDVDKSLGKTQSALADVNKLLKLDPSNTELLAQKQKLLKDAISDTEKRLETLKEADKNAKKQLDSGDLGQDKYDALQREIIETEEKLKSLKETAKDSASKVSMSMSDIGKGAKKASDTIAPVSTAAAGLMAAAVATVPATEELRTDLSKLDENARGAGVGIDETRKAFEQFSIISDEVDSSVEATSNLLQAGFTESNLQKAIEGLSGAYLRFPDTLKIESLADSLQETLATGKTTGQFGELLDRLGIGADNFNAKLELLTTTTDKQNYALQVLADAGLMDTYESYKKNNEALIESKQANLDFQIATAELAETLVPVVTKITAFTASLIEWFNGLSNGAKTFIAILVSLVAVAAPVLAVVGNIATGTSNLVKVFNSTSQISAVVGKVTGFVKTALTGLFTLIKAHPIIAVVSAIVGIIVLLYNKCEWFRNGVNVIIERVVNIVTTLPDKVKEIFDRVKTTITNTVTNVKNYAVTGFANLVSGVSSKLSAITSTVKNAFNGAVSYLKNLKNQAVTWGKDFMDGMISGIKKKISSIVNAVKGVANKIASYLHFSRPDKGELHYYEEWMPDFMDGLAKGIKNNTYLVENAVKALNAKMANLNPNMNMNYSIPNPSVSFVANTHVQIGNKTVTDYVTETAIDGISRKQINGMKAGGYYV